MNIRIYVLVVFLTATLFDLKGQMNINGQTLYGNEWIDYNKSYYKIKVAEDGLYKIDYKTLADAGFFENGKLSGKIILYNFGIQQPIYLTSDTEMKDNDYILFYGERNRSDLDTFLYENRYSQLLNPDISLFSDTSVYYLVYNPSVSNVSRMNVVNPNYTNIVEPPSKFYWHSESRNYFNLHYKPVLNSDDVRYSYFVKPEGFVKSFSFKTIDTFELKDLYTENSLEGHLSLTISNSGNNVNNKTIKFNDEILGTDGTQNNNISRLNYSIENNKLKGQNIFKIEGSSSDENHGLANATFKMPRKYVFENNRTYNVNTNDKFFKIENFKIEHEFVYEISSNTLYKVNTKNTTSEIFINNTNDKEFVLQFKPIDIKNLQKVSFKDYSKLDGQYLIISSKKLFTSEGGNINQIENYREYRSSEKGGSFKTIVIYADEIYDQFGYGV